MQWKTVVCVVAVVAAIVAISLLGDEKLAAVLVPVLGIMGTATAGAMRGIFSGPPTPPDPKTAPTIPPPPKVPPVGLAALAFIGCASLSAQKDEASAAYLAEQLRCVDSNSSRAAADACRLKVREQWAAADAATSAEAGK